MDEETTLRGPALQALYVLKYKALGKKMVCEYWSEHEANENMFDIQGYGIDCELTRQFVEADYKLKPGPYEEEQE